MNNRKLFDRRLARRIKFWIFLACGGIVFTGFGYWLSAITR